MSVVSNLLVPIENQRPEKTLRFLLLSESRRTLPHPHNRWIIDSNPTGSTIPSEKRSAPQAGSCNLFAITASDNVSERSETTLQLSPVQLETMPVS
jgi:hypothetical protein